MVHFVVIVCAQSMLNIGSSLALICAFRVVPFQSPRLLNCFIDANCCEASIQFNFSMVMVESSLAVEGFHAIFFILDIFSFNCFLFKPSLKSNSFLFNFLLLTF